MHDYKMHIILYVTTGIKFKKYFKLLRGMYLSSGCDNFANIICLETSHFTFKNKKILNLFKIIFFPRAIA